MDTDRKPTIAIFGHTGMVGSTIFRYYTQKGFKVYGKSLDIQTAGFDEYLPSVDYVFVCVPTPFNWETKQYDLSIVEEVFNNLCDLAAQTLPDQVVILKSTVTPGTTVRLQKDYSEIKIIFNPEFLSEATADNDFANPDRQLVGYTDDSFSRASETLHFLPNSPYSVIMPATEAEITKYVNNFHGALMVIFANLIFDICQKKGADYEVVKKASKASKWVGSPMGRMYWEVNHAGYRGYGGACFPKDMNMLQAWLKEMGITAEIVDGMIEANRRYLKMQDLTEEQVEKITQRVVR